MSTVYELPPAAGDASPACLPSITIDRLESLACKLLQSILTSEDSHSVYSLSSGKHPSKKGVFSSPVRLRHFSQTVYLLKLIHGLMLEQRQVNQRELFYRSLSDSAAPSFADQASMNRALFSLLNVLGCDRHELGIFTTARGLIATDPQQQTLCLDASGEFIADIADHSDGLSVSEKLIQTTLIQTSAKFVLIVEKETVFQSLLACTQFFRHCPCLLVTARGYPDNITIRFLRTLTLMTKNALPFLYLGDLDPHGIAIMMTYMNALDGRMEWLGVKSDDILTLPHQGVMGLKMKSTDFSVLTGLIEKDSVPAHVKSELAKLESRGLKYEVECLHSVGESFLATEWLPGKVKPFLQ